MCSIAPRLHPIGLFRLFLFRFHLRPLDRLDADPPDPRGVGPEDREAVAADLDRVSGLGQAAEEVEDQAAGRLGLGLGDLQPTCSASTSSGQEASTSKTPFPMGVICGVSRSNSSWIGPTSSSRTFSRVAMPTTLPYSSSSMARCTRLFWNSSRSWLSLNMTGRNGTLRELAEVEPPVLNTTRSGRCP